jgi:hypothetical protein
MSHYVLLTNNSYHVKLRNEIILKEMLSDQRFIQETLRVEIRVDDRISVAKIIG